MLQDKYGAHPENAFGFCAFPVSVPGYSRAHSVCFGCMSLRVRVSCDVLRGMWLHVRESFYYGEGCDDMQGSHMIMERDLIACWSFCWSKTFMTRRCVRFTRALSSLPLLSPWHWSPLHQSRWAARGLRSSSECRIMTPISASRAQNAGTQVIDKSLGITVHQSGWGGRAFSLLWLNEFAFRFTYPNRGRQGHLFSEEDTLQRWAPQFLWNAMVGIHRKSNLVRHFCHCRMKNAL